MAGLILVWIELVGHKRTGIRRETAAIQLKELGAACPNFHLILTSQVNPSTALITLPGRLPKAGVLHLTKEHNSLNQFVRRLDGSVGSSHAGRVAPRQTSYSYLQRETIAPV